MSDKSLKLVQIEGEIEHFFEQIISPIKAIATTNGNISNVSEKAICNVLWLVHDRAWKMKNEADKAIKIAKEATNDNAKS